MDFAELYLGLSGACARPGNILQQIMRKINKTKLFSSSYALERPISIYVGNDRSNSIP